MKLGFLSAAMLFVASNAMAQHAHMSQTPRETGQSQFAAIAEIVTLLRVDPDTDWAQVDIKALRDHLIDMDNVTTIASVERTVDGMNVRFMVTGDQVVAESIKRIDVGLIGLSYDSSVCLMTVNEADFHHALEGFYSLRVDFT